MYCLLIYNYENRLFGCEDFTVKTAFSVALDLKKSVSPHVTVLMAVRNQRVSVWSFSTPPASVKPHLCDVTSWLSLLCDVNICPSQAIPNGFVLFVAHMILP